MVVGVDEAGEYHMTSCINDFIRIRRKFVRKAHSLDAIAFNKHRSVSDFSPRIIHSSNSKGIFEQSGFHALSLFPSLKGRGQGVGESHKRQFTLLPHPRLTPP